MRIDELSGDSTVTALRFEGGVVSLLYDDAERDERFEVRVATQWLYSEAASEEGSVHVRLIKLADRLPVDAASGRFMAPEGWSAQASASREGLLAAVGRRAAEYAYLLQVRGYKIVLACPLGSIDDVSVQPAERPRA